MNILKRYNYQKTLYEQGLDFSFWERWSVFIEDDRDHFVSGNFHFSFSKLGAWLWGMFKVGNKRKWKLIRQKHSYL